MPHTSWLQVRVIKTAHFHTHLWTSHLNPVEWLLSSLHSNLLMPLLILLSYEANGGDQQDKCQAGESHREPHKVPGILAGKRHNVRLGATERLCEIAWLARRADPCIRRAVVVAAKLRLRCDAGILQDRFECIGDFLVTARHFREVQRQCRALS